MVERANNSQEERIFKLMAREFIEERLGMDAKPEDVQNFAQHISQFIQMHAQNSDWK